MPESLDDAEAYLDAIEPRPAARPIVVLGGYLDPIGAFWLAEQIRGWTSGPILEVDFFCCWTFDECRDALIEAVEAEFPGQPVDVVALSMGGLVARHADERLCIARLFTIATPHHGAEAAALPAAHPLHLDMRADSEFIRTLNARPVHYEVYPYVALDDHIVGDDNAAPPGMTPLWVASGPLAWAHISVALDPRVQADLARRLRGE
jgi:hypothetical protein